MTTVNMNKEQFKINLSDPEIPAEVRDASRNHGGMTVPEGFFSQFEQKMNAVIDTAEEPAQNYRQWIGIAAAVVALLVIGAAFQFDWLGTTIEQQDYIAETDVVTDEELDPTQDIYYTSLSDYEVYDLICGI